MAQKSQGLGSSSSSVFDWLLEKLWALYLIFGLGFTPENRGGMNNKAVVSLTDSMSESPGKNPKMYRFLSPIPDLLNQNSWLCGLRICISNKFISSFLYTHLILAVRWCLGTTRLIISDFQGPGQFYSCRILILLALLTSRNRSWINPQFPVSTGFFRSTVVCLLIDI